MSILQEYEWIRKSVIGEKKYKDIEWFLSVHPELFLSDVYYKESIWKQFEKEEAERSVTP